MRKPVEVYCQFDPLEEVWLGDCYPEEFYADLPPQIRSTFAIITEITKKDLDKLEKVLRSLGLKVHRPKFSNSADDYRDAYGNLLKPPIAPRDDNMALGEVFFHLRHSYAKNPWQHVLDHYASHGTQVYQALFLEKYGYLQPAGIVRVGKDIYIDIDSHSHSWHLIERDVIPEWKKDFRIIACRTAGHSDSVFCVPCPGQIITSHWKHDYSKEFPGWKVYHLPHQPRKMLSQEQAKDWWIKGQENVSHPAFNEYIMSRAKDWVGAAQETVFEVNSLVINPGLILTTGRPDEKTQEWFAHNQIEYIPIEFSARTFWDSGVHCLTVDTKRQGTQKDYFPERNQDVYFV